MTGNGTSHRVLCAVRTAWIPLLALLAGVPWSMCSRTATAQSASTADAPAPRYTFALVGVPLPEALGALIDATEINLVYESDLVEGKTAFCRARQQPQEAVLACILAGTGLDYYRLSSGTYVLFGDPRTRPRYGRLAGLVIDAETGTPLPDANVLLVDAETGTSTNQAGRFAFAALKPGPHVLVVTHVAYHDQVDTVWIAPEASRRVALSLKARTVLTSPIIISGLTSRLPSEDLGRGHRTADELERAPGTRDVVQDIDAIVGVHVGNALSDVHVQGGAAGEHQYLLDGATVFVPIHNGGFFGPFSPFAIEQITVQKAGFGAAHGSHLSGVVEVDHRLGAPAWLGGEVQVDPYSLNGRLGGKKAIRSGLRAEWMVAGRAGLWDLYQPGELKELFRSWSTPVPFLVEALRTPGEAPDADTGAPAPTAFGAPIEMGFTDLHAALGVRVNGLHSFYASFYRGDNLFGEDINVASTPGGTEGEDVYSWGNTTSQIRYEGVLSSRLSASLRGWRSSYEFSHPFDRSPFASIDPDRSGAPAPEDFNDVSEVGLGAGWNLAAAARHFLSGDVEAVRTGSEFSLSLDPSGATPAIDSNSRKPAHWRLSAFLEDRLALSHRLTLALGTRLTYLPALRRAYAEPRLAVRYDRRQGRRGTWAVYGAVGLYQQFIHQFDVSSYGTTALVPSVRFWLPVGADGRPPRAYHATAAVHYKPTPAWGFGVESFYKYQPHALVLDYGGRQDPAPGQTLLRASEGYAYGIAFSVDRTTQTSRFTAHYEYSVARRRVPNRFDGAFVAAPWSTPHRILASLDVAPLPHLTATLRWQGIVGRTWGFRQAYYDYLEPDPDTRRFGVYDLSDPEAHRLPLFSQWDVGLAYSHDVAGLGLQARLNLLNVLGRRNVIDWSLAHDDARDAYVRSARHTTPFLPSLSLRVTW